MLDFFPHRGVAVVTDGHDVDVNVAITGVAKAGDRKSVLCLQRFGELHQIDQAAARHDYVLVQFREAGRAKRITKLTAQRPELFAICLASRQFERVWFSFLEQFANGGGLAANARLLSVEIDQQMRVALGHNHFAQIASGRFQREVVGDLQ